MSADIQTNPLLAEWDTPFEAPPFGAIEPEHYAPAIDAALAAHLAEVQVVKATSDAPTFANTIEALELAGRSLRILSVFYNLTSSHTNDKLMEIERDLAPRLSTHFSKIEMDPVLFARVDTLQTAQVAGTGEPLTAEQARVLERYHTGAVRAGTQLDEAQRAEMTEMGARLSSLGTEFTQNVLKAEKSFELPLSADDMERLPDFLRDAVAATAQERESDAAGVVTLSRSSVEPFLSFAPQRDLREQAFKAWVERGGAGEIDNRPLIREMLELRQKRAALLGYDSFAAFKTADNMAKTPDAVEELLLEVWGAAQSRVLEEREELAAEAKAGGDNAEIAPWDWRYYSEQVKQKKHALDEAEIKPYFQLEEMIEAAFFTAHKLFGLSFVPRDNVPTYHEDVRVWEVLGREGEHVGLFFGDYFARPSKRGGAWMSAFRSQRRTDGDVRPIIVNVLNFVKGAAGEPTLLSFDDARTLFHEFGHGLHGLLSDVTYPRISGTSVARDFVELPSQLYEHWLEEPEVLRRFARHAETGETIPQALLDKVLAARNYGQGFSTTEYLACALLDMKMHRMTEFSSFDIDAFEKDALGAINMPEEMVMRHRPVHFLHLFSGDGYASGYYSYMWSEVMDADAFDAFSETGDVFNAEMASRLYEAIYSAGGRQDPRDAYLAFRGRMPKPDALLRHRGLAG